MRDAMAAIVSPEVDKDNKMIAWDNFEQLIENLDNANNMEPLGMWTPLIEQLSNAEADYRMMACWCVSTAVQNNTKSQERLHAFGAVPTLVKLATTEQDKAVRKKAILALSSAIRNNQPNLDSAMKALPAGDKPEGNVDAEDMEAVGDIVQKLRDQL